MVRLSLTKIGDSEIMARRKTDFTNIKCISCKDNNLTSRTAHSEDDIDGNWTGSWLCSSCYNKKRYKNGKTNANLKNEMRDRRTNNLDHNSTQAKGDMFQKLTCIWRSTVSIIPVEDLNIKFDNYNTPIDHSQDSELGIIETKGSFYSEIASYEWCFNTKRERKKYVDKVICYCVSKDKKNIARLYIFPKEELNRNNICIYENPTRSTWYEKYRITDKNILSQINDIWRIINNEKLCL